MSMAKTSFDFSRMTDEEVKILDGIIEKLPKLSKYALKYLYREVKCHYFMEHDLYHVEIDDEEAIRRRKAAGENLDCPSPIRFADGLIKEKVFVEGQYREEQLKVQTDDTATDDNGSNT
jgi:ribulose-5-phosphate 4-epimerase/fuculose-1-phosphate aldolase